MIFIEKHGINIPALGYGTWQLEGNNCLNGVAMALDVGYRHIDTAQIYGNEAEVGTAIAGSGIARGDIFLTTKVWTSEVADGKLQKSVDISLQKLKTDYVDLLLIHWPTTAVPFTEQLKALQQVQQDGKAKLIGISNFTLAQIKEAHDTLGAPVVTNQVEYHPYLSQQAVLDCLRARNMFLTAYSPLARGRVNDDVTLQKIGGKYGKTPGQVTLRWLIQQDNVAAIPKAASEKNLRSNFEIFDFALTDAEMTEISALARIDGRIVNPDFAPDWD